MELPAAFEKRMQEMLGAEYPVFRTSYEQPHKRGIRLNTLKCDAETLAASLPFPLVQTPFSPLSYYAPEDVKMTALPLYHAGAFYSQEPSASSAVTLLAPEPGDKVLDLCAAPGGKSTQIAALTGDRGLLWSNEVVRSRACVLASNIERMGIRNAVVSSVYPEVLAEKLTGYFDKVLVDAPCSGEGMFRRDPAAADEWSPEHVTSCAARQTAILASAARCVREGGILVYSTCTFSEEENEGVVRRFLRENPEFVLEKPQVPFGRPAYGTNAVRIFPMDGGEGHFAARFRRTAPNASAAVPYAGEPDRQTDAAAQALYAQLFSDRPGRFARVKDRVLLLPDELPVLSGLGVLRAGVEFGELKKNRMEPAHGIFMASRAEHCRSVLSLAHNDPALAAFLRGEEIPAERLQGYTAVAADGIVTGFGKAFGGVLKNKYPKGLRIHP
ncbi:MAG: RsmB/NOP family class I SAM-dependent RNA methyltransferase [Hominenteromicrobium sp.]